MKESEIKIVNIEEKEDGIADVDVVLPMKFRRWFLEKENLERWDDEVFKKRLIAILEGKLDKIDAESLPPEKKTRKPRKRSK